MSTPLQKSHGLVPTQVSEIGEERDEGVVRRGSFICTVL